MINLEQKRAAAAIEFWKNNSQDTGGVEGGDVIRGFSALVINNGLLAAMSTGIERKKGYEVFGEEIGSFLVKQNIIPAPERSAASTKESSRLKAYLELLAKCDSITLQRATSEALAYISYLKRLRK